MNKLLILLFFLISVNIFSQAKNYEFYIHKSVVDNKETFDKPTILVTVGKGYFVIDGRFFKIIDYREDRDGLGNLINVFTAKAEDDGEKIGIFIDEVNHKGAFELPKRNNMLIYFFITEKR